MKRRRLRIANGRSNAGAFLHDCSPGGTAREAEKLAREGVALAADGEFLVLHADVLLDLAEVLALAGRMGGCGGDRRRSRESLRTQGQRRLGEESTPVSSIEVTHPPCSTRCGRRPRSSRRRH